MAVLQEMFSAPVLVSDGFSYEYSAITECVDSCSHIHAQFITHDRSRNGRWMAEHKTSPLTMEVCLTLHTALDITGLICPNIGRMQHALMSCTMLSPTDCMATAKQLQ